MVWKRCARDGFKSIMISIAVLAGAERVEDASTDVFVGTERIEDAFQDVFMGALPRQAIMTRKALAVTHRGSSFTSFRLVGKESSMTRQIFWTLEDEPIPEEKETFLKANVKILRVLGKGNFGSVQEMKVECATADESQSIAMKTLPLTDEETLPLEKYAFQKISSLQLSDDSPYLMRLIFAVRDKTRALFFTPVYNSGMLLHATRVTNWDQRLAFFLDIVKGIREMHRANLTHTDLKPENVMINCDKRCFQMKEKRIQMCKMSERTCAAVVIDIGLATDAGGSGFLRGTPGFIPPEIIKQDEDQDACLEGCKELREEQAIKGCYIENCRDPVWEQSVDIWSLGSMMYELRFGSELIQGSGNKHLWKDRTKEYDPKSILCNSGGGHDCDIRQLISQMTDTNSTRRPSIASVVSSVDKLLKEKVSPAIYEKAVQDPVTRKAMKPSPKCLDVMV